MKTQQPILITSIAAAEDLSAKQNLLIKIDGTLCGNGEKALGALAANTNDTEMAPVICLGIANVYSGDVITAGDKLQSNAAGKVITYASGETVGYALDAATGADEIVRVLLVHS